MAFKATFDQGGAAAGGEELSRRSFLAWASAALGGLVAAVLGGMSGGYFASPLFEKSSENWTDLGPVSAAPVGKPYKVEFMARQRDGWVVTEKRASAWLMTADGKTFVAYDPRCTHLGCPYRWDDQQGKFLCPCHSAVFDAEGKVVSGPPPRPLDRYRVKVERGRVLVLPEAIRSAA